MTYVLLMAMNFCGRIHRHNVEINWITPLDALFEYIALTKFEGKLLMKSRPEEALEKAQVSVEMDAEVNDSCCFGILNIKSGTVVFGVIWALFSIITLSISIPSSNIPVANYSIAIGLLGIVVVVPLFMAVWMDRPLLLAPFAITLVLYLVLTVVTAFYLIQSLTRNKLSHRDDTGEVTFAVVSLGLLAAIVFLDVWSLAVLKQCYSYLRLLGMVPHSVKNAEFYHKRMPPLLLVCLRVNEVSSLHVQNETLHCNSDKETPMSLKGLPAEIGSRSSYSVSDRSSSTSPIQETSPWRVQKSPKKYLPLNPSLVRLSIRLLKGNPMDYRHVLQATGLRQAP
ncbi:hypothetical protein QR680_018039 [Steinernema hermaphroditum]|uniref:Uncharacterized protein n=1 Tax=Steinernema hermaphroditum TaxID=289476 RepID=A0AA39LQ39_9BILA|nr:hypothetical protein QR680_018039 [Steinernema hermaphroditum]